MADARLNGSKPALGSDWDGLNSNLVASFFAIKKRNSDDKNTIRWERDMDQREVKAPLTDGSAEATLNWQSPFENMGPDQKLSTFSSMLQAGGFSSFMAQLKALLPTSGIVKSTAESIAKTEGMSNLTKLNSTQVFTGMPPVKISVTAHFRAYANAAEEVRAPMDQLMAWAVPKKIAPDGVVAEALRGGVHFFPSEVPQIIGMKYADRLWAPIVIESIPYPLTGPRGADGVMLNAAMVLQLASLTAWDANDWRQSASKQNFASYRY